MLKTLIDQVFRPNESFIYKEWRQGIVLYFKNQKHRNNKWLNSRNDGKQISTTQQFHNRLSETLINPL